MQKKKNDLNNIPAHHKVVVVGGGIAGAGVFRDLSLHNISTLLIDKKDFTSQTSQSSSKMLHGGIRYLENMDFALVWEALHEKNLWLKLTPHLAYPEKFYLPVFRDSLRPLWMVRIGLFIYDALSSFLNVPHEIANIKKVKDHFPFIKSEGLRGAGVYSDAVVDDAKLTLECIYDGLVSPRSFALNHTSLIEAQKTPKGYLLALEDQISGERVQLTCEYLVFTTGPFTDKVLQDLNLFPWQSKLILSRGSHLWIKNETLKATSPMVLTPSDGRVIFVIPQNNKTLVGTTEVVGDASFDQMPSDDEVDYLLKNLSDFFPTAEIDTSCIIEKFAGTRPLVKENPDENLGMVARNHKVYQPQENAYVLLGGKYTTFRIMAQDVVSPLLHKMNKPYLAELTLQPLRAASKIEPWKEVKLNREILRDIITKELPRNEEDLIKRRLGINDIDAFPEVKTFLRDNKDLLPWKAEYQE